MLRLLLLALVPLSAFGADVITLSTSNPADYNRNVEKITPVKVVVFPAESGEPEIKFEIIEVLSDPSVPRGNMSRIYKAQDLSSGEIGALRIPVSTLPQANIASSGETTLDYPVELLNEIIDGAPDLKEKKIPTLNILKQRQNTFVFSEYVPHLVTLLDLVDSKKPPPEAQRQKILHALGAFAKNAARFGAIRDLVARNIGINEASAEPTCFLFDYRTFEATAGKAVVAKPFEPNRKGHPFSGILAFLEDQKQIASPAMRKWITEVQSEIVSGIDSVRGKGFANRGKRSSLLKMMKRQEAIRQTSTQNGWTCREVLNY